MGTVKSKRREKTHPIETLLSKVKSRAKKRGIPFNITVQDIRIPKRCPILGIKLVLGRETGITNSPSIDRINPRKGYIKGNVQIISQKANKMKNDATRAELRRFAKWIDKFINNNK